MPPTHNYTNSGSFYPRHSMLPSANPAMTMGPPASSSSVSMSTTKQRQYAQLESKLAQLNANLADTKNLVGVTAVQAQDMRFLGGYVGALFMGAAGVLGEQGKEQGQGEQQEEVEASEGSGSP